MKKIILLIMLIFLDQLTKFLIPGITNTGAAFGILQGQNIFLILLSLIVISIIIFYYKKYKELRLYLILILSGVIGNLIDRIFFGYVRDFINLKIWPVFNLADSYSVTGVILLVYIIYFKKK